MPWVEVIYKRDVNQGALDRLSRRIQAIIAGALHVPEHARAGLSPDDVEFDFREAGIRSKCEQVNIIIQANSYPEREVDINERVKKIAKEVCELLNGENDGVAIHGMVYIPTMRGFAEF
jgi:hypothetical protein